MVSVVHQANFAGRHYRFYRPALGKKNMVEEVANMRGIKTQITTFILMNKGKIVVAILMLLPILVIFYQTFINPTITINNMYRFIDTSIGNENVLDIPPIGEWKPGNKYIATCDLQGRNTNSECCENVQPAHFEFFDRSLRNDPSVLGEFLSKTRGKNVTIFGDSVQINLFLAVAELLQLGE